NVSRFRSGTANDHAIDLVEQVDKLNHGHYLEEITNGSATDFCIGVAGYAEKHFEAPNLDYDISRLKEKVEAGGDYIVTQMFFDNNAFFEFVAKCRSAGVDVPIVPGLKILTRKRHLNFLPKFFNLNIPEELAEQVEAK